MASSSLHNRKVAGMQGITVVTVVPAKKEEEFNEFYTEVIFIDLL
jgi:hypothetical protein